MNDLFVLEYGGYTVTFENERSYLSGLIDSVHSERNPDIRKALAAKAIEVLNSISLRSHGDCEKVKNAIEELGDTKPGIDSWQKRWEVRYALEEVETPGEITKSPKIELKQEK